MSEKDLLDTDASFINLHDKVSPIVLASIFGCNVSLLYQEAQAGRLPSVLVNATYIECIQMYIRHFKKNQDLKIEKARLDIQAKEAKLAKELELREARRSARKESGGSEEDDGLHPLIAAKMKQDIRLGIAKEAQLWLKASIDRSEYLSVEVLVELCEPFIMSIRNGLLSIALTSPEAEKQIDLIMDNLYNLGVQLVEEAEVDAKSFVTRILEKEIDIDDIEIDGKPGTIL